MRYTLLYFILICTMGTEVHAQQTHKINPELLTETWNAKWVTCPGITGKEFGVYLFRKSFTLDSVSKEFIIHVSADNRYKLYVNGEYVTNGPARGDALHWRFESLDISDHLRMGKNVISAVVWNFAEFRPMAQHTTQTGFILQGNTTGEEIVNTDSTWYVKKDSSYSPLPVHMNAYYVVGPGERFNGEKHPWGWEGSDYHVSEWNKVVALENGTPQRSLKKYGSPADHVLIQRPIPLMEEKIQRFAKIRRTNLSGSNRDFLEGKHSITIPADTTITILIDQEYLTNAYPVLIYSDGKGSEIKMTYAESLFDQESQKGNRNEIDRKVIKGNQDQIRVDGGKDRMYESLWWRNFRYIQIDIQTSHEPLILEDFYSIFTGYPFEEKASFNSSYPGTEAIWKTGWRTQRLCAGETFFDCPYYEQLQYIGDSRIQCLVSSYVSGDTTLMRNALSLMNDSRMSFGLTQSRYPSYGPQIIPTFSLIWITMVHDYWMLCQDNAFIKSMMPGIIETLNWYESRIDSTGMVSHPEWWNFVDWVEKENWDSDVPPGLHTTTSSILNLQYVYTLQSATELLESFGYKESADHYNKLAQDLKGAVKKACYDSNKGLIADTPLKNSFSQHANVLGILTNTIPPAEQVRVMEEIKNDKEIALCSYYFTFYLIQAMEKSGLSSEYISTLDSWEDMLDLGLTTFAEKADPTRSDCHAWSASPVYYFLSLVCGIKPNEPGFKTVRIEPHPGDLKSIEGAMPHRLGMIEVVLKRDRQDRLVGEINLPKGLTGTFVWNGQTQPLKEGVNEIRTR